MRKGLRDLVFGGGGGHGGSGGWTLRVASLVGLVSRGGFDDLGWSWWKLDVVGWHELGECFGARWACQFIVGVMRLAHSGGFDGLGGRRRRA